MRSSTVRASRSPSARTANAAIRAAAPRHTLTLDAPAQLQAQVDPIRFEQVVVNLVENAVKYSPNGGLVTVGLSPTGDGILELAVRDWGIGIAPEHREQIFSRFFQAHAKGYYGGMGLGLYISREIVQQHGGRIWAETPDDGGTRVVVAIPAMIPAPAQDESKEAAPERGAQKLT